MTEDATDVEIEGSDTKAFTFVNKKEETLVPSIKGYILINKIDENSRPLEGAEFTLYNNNNKQIIKVVVSDKNGMVFFEELSPGTYYVKETKAPDDYELITDEKEFKITESKTYSYKFKNVPNDIALEDPDAPKGWEDIDDLDVPQEGTLPDTGNVLNNWILAVIGSLLILTGMVLIKRKEI